MLEVNIIKYTGNLCRPNAIWDFEGDFRLSDGSFSISFQLKNNYLVQIYN